MIDMLSTLMRRYTDLAEQPDTDLPKIQDQFWEEIATLDYPIKEEYTGEMVHDSSLYELVTFLYRAQGVLDNVFILAELNHVTPNEYVFEHISGTNIYHKSFVLPKGAQAQYRIIENDTLGGIFAGAKYKDRRGSLKIHPDPLSKHLQIFKDGFGPNQDYVIAHLRAHKSEVEELIQDATSQGQVTELEHNSEILGYSRTVNVYTPPEYNPQNRYPCLMLFDGTGFLQYAKVNSILDNLIASKTIRPLIAVFIDPGMKDGETTRYEEFPLHVDFARSMVDELIPFVNISYPLSENVEDHVISGSSYGGLAAIYIALHHSDRVGKVISLSGSVHYGVGDEHELLIKEFAFGDKVDINLKLYVGKLEGEYHWNSPEWANQLASHRHFETILEMRGYDFTYTEYAGDHGFAAWLEPLIEGLTYYFKV